MTDLRAWSPARSGDRDEPVGLRRRRRELDVAEQRADDARRRYEAGLDECRRFLQRAQVLGRIGIWRCEASDDPVLHWSAETYRIVGFGEARPELRLSEFLALVHPDDVTLVRETFARVADDGEPRTIEYRVVRPDGTEGWLQESVEAMPPGPSGPTELTGVLRDVTEHRRAVEQLRHSQRMEIVGEFASTIAHDVNNLSTVIMGYAHLAASEANADEDPTGELDQINKAADSIAALTRQLLAFSRRQVLEPVLLDLSDTITTLEPAVRSLVGPGVELVLRRPPRRVTVRADQSQLEQVVLNLVLNARDATAPDGTITLETVEAELASRVASDGGVLPAGEYVGLRVVDTGFGMDEATRTRCFEPFFTTKPLGRGTGLGLATVSAIAHRHGGGTDVESTPGLGSRFTVWLPRAPVGARAAAPSRTGP
jgi:PAS domain S-box-containing protein